MDAVYELTGLLQNHFPINYARVTLIAQMILAMVKVRTVTLSEIADGFAGKTKTASNERRIRRFLSSFNLDLDFVALFVGGLLPGGRWLLTTDRTTWSFGTTTINILVLGVVHKGVAVPLLWKFLPRCGNSDTAERIEIMERFVRLFGAERAEALLGDREFIGNEWLAWLRDSGIEVFIRIREDQLVENSRGELIAASVLFRDLRAGETRVLSGLRKLGRACGENGVRACVAVMRLESGELLIVVTFGDPRYALDTYARRWEIETMFACLKTRGFRLESTHIKDTDRLSRLLAIVVMAFVWAYVVGDLLNEKDPIVIKKHGRREISVFRKGYNHIRHILINLIDFAEEFSGIIRVFSKSKEYTFREPKS